MSHPGISVLPSPCIDVCRMHGATGWCEGCCRTLDEIAAWSSMPERHKLQVWKQLPARRESIQPMLDAARAGQQRSE